MKNMPVAVALSGLALMLSSLSQVVHADSFIDAPRAVSTASFESMGHAGLIVAGANTSIKNLNRLTNGRRVRLNGTVDGMHGSHGFTIHDPTGAIDVSLTSSPPASLKKGSDVAVSGRIVRSLLGATSIEARSVTLQHKQDDQAETAKPDKQVKNAPSYSIQTLPETGVVKVSGVVTTSDNARQFVLKDATGLVDVTVEKGDASDVLKGAKVTVVGLVDRGVLGKDISANSILVEKNDVMASAE